MAKETGALTFSLPSHWQILKLKHVASLKSGEGITAESINAEGDYPVYGGNGVRGYSSSFTHDGHFVLIGRQGALCGNINYASGKFWASEHAVVVSPRQRIAVRWLAELLRSMNLNQYSLSAAQPGLAVERIRELRIPFPPWAEQAMLAESLEKETARVDSLTQRKERQVELLQEKRQAIITREVTKGLNPNAKMIPSGIRWLGDVPADWKIAPIKWVISKADYGISDSLDASGAVLVLRMNNIQDGKINYADVKYVDTVDKNLVLNEGDLLYNRTNSLEMIGKVGLFAGCDEAELVSFASYLVRLRTNERAIPQYLALLLNTPAVIGHARALAYPSINQANLNPTRYLTIKIPVPAVIEQQAIAAHALRKAAEITDQISLIQQSIALLSEYRASFITAAVFGQIDVSKFRDGAREHGSAR